MAPYGGQLFFASRKKVQKSCAFLHPEGTYRNFFRNFKKWLRAGKNGHYVAIFWRICYVWRNVNTGSTSNYLWPRGCSFWRQRCPSAPLGAQTCTRRRLSGAFGAFGARWHLFRWLRHLPAAPAFGALAPRCLRHLAAASIFYACLPRYAGQPSLHPYFFYPRVGVYFFGGFGDFSHQTPSEKWGFFRMVLKKVYPHSGVKNPEFAMLARAQKKVRKRGPNPVSPITFFEKTTL